MPYIVIYTTYPTQEDASAAAKGLIENKLASCVNVFPACLSYYQWEGLAREAPEHGMFIKTTEGKWDEVKDFLEKSHPYEVPAILAMPMTKANDSFLSWLNQQVN